MWRRSRGSLIKPSKSEIHTKNCSAWWKNTQARSRQWHGEPKRELVGWVRCPAFNHLISRWGFTIRTRGFISTKRLRFSRDDIALIVPLRVDWHPLGVRYGTYRASKTGSTSSWGTIARLSYLSKVLKSGLGMIWLLFSSFIIDVSCYRDIFISKKSNISAKTREVLSWLAFSPSYIHIIPILL